MTPSTTSGPSVELLVQHIARLRVKIESERDSIIYGDGLLLALEELGGALSEEPQDPARLKRGAFGLFRLVTDSRELEEGEVGREALAVHNEVGKLVKVIET